MPLKAFEQKRIYQHVAEHIAELIRSGEFQEGQQLPPERDLAKTLKISRNVVREALLALEIVGYVEIRVGVGTFVVSASPSDNRIGHLRGIDAGAAPTDILAARRAVEGEVAAIAAATATEEEITQVRAALDEIKKNGNSPNPEIDWPRVFHERVAEATHNPVLVSIVNQLWEQTRGPLFEKFRLHTKMHENRRQRQIYRQRLVDCLERGDVDGARGAMQGHLDDVASYIFKKAVT